MRGSKGLRPRCLAVGHIIHIVRTGSPSPQSTTLTYIFSWTKLKYPIPRDKRIRLATLYFELCTIPGMPINVIAACADSFVLLTRSRKKLSIDDLRLPWKPIYNILKQDLFLTRREFEYKYALVTGHEHATKDVV